MPLVSLTAPEPVIGTVEVVEHTNHSKALVEPEIQDVFHNIALCFIYRSLWTIVVCKWLTWHGGNHGSQRRGGGGSDSHCGG